MNDRPSLSVVVANYNHAQYLSEALESFISQSHPADEIIIVDDASTDHSVSLIQKYAENHSEIRLHQNSTNRGPAAALNLGITLSSSDYLLFCGADDIVLPSFFEIGLSFLQKHPHVGLFCAKACHFYDDAVNELEEEPDQSQFSSSKEMSPKEAVRLFRTTN